MSTIELTSALATLGYGINVKDAAYGAVGDGLTDDTAALDAAVSACPDGGTVFLPPGVYKRTTAWVINKNINIVGAGVFTLISSASSFAPDTDPYITGTIILQTTAGTNGITLSGSGKQVNLRDFGVKFADAIRHLDTGHGIAGTPPPYLSGSDHGPMNCVWDNVYVFGTDGDHYGFYLINPIYCTLRRIYSFGGGGLYMYCDSYGGNYGNTTIEDCQLYLWQAGTSSGLYIDGRSAPGAGTGVMSLIALIRPSIYEISNTGAFPETTPPAANSTTQWGMYISNNVNNFSLFQPDIEPATSAVSIPDRQKFVDPAGYLGWDINGPQTNTIGVMKAAFYNGGRTMMSDMSFLGVVEDAVLTAGANAGTGAPTPVAASGAFAGDYAGRITFGSGSGPAAGIMAHVAYGNTRSTYVRVIVTPNNSFAKALGLYADNITSAGFDICAETAPAASQAVTKYQVSYDVASAG